jgi:hypothetical protein
MTDFPNQEEAFKVADQMIEDNKRDYEHAGGCPFIMIRDSEDVF